MIKKIKDFFKTNRIFWGIAWTKCKSYYFLYLVSVIYSTTNNMVLVYLPKLSLDAFLTKKNFFLGCLYIFSSIMLSVLWSYFERKISIKQSLNVTHIALEMRERLYKKIIDNNLLIYEDSGSFDSLQRAMNYTDVGADELIGLLSKFLTGIFTIIGVSYVIGEISPIMVIIVLCSLILAHLCMRKVNRLWFEYQNNERLPKVRLVNFLSGLFNDKAYVTEVKLNNAFEFTTKTLKHRRVELAQESAQKNMEGFKWNYLSILINSFQLLASHIYFGYLLFSGMINIATYSTLFAAIEQFSSSFSGLLGTTTEIENKVNEASFYMRYLEDNAYVGTGNIKIDEFDKISFKNVVFFYPNQTDAAIKNISISINAGEKIAIVGENGSGKSTLLKLMLGLYPTTQGDIIINDIINVRDIDLRSWYSKLSVVMQNTVHLPLTICEDITLCFKDEVDKEKYEDSINFANIKCKIETLSEKEDSIFSTQFDKNGVDFSGGEKQRLSIARAAYKSANILVFDEPSSALDPNAEFEFFERIYELGREKTVIFVSHRLSTVTQADKIIFMENGKIVEVGNHNELINSNGPYSQMYNKQATNYLRCEK